MTEEKPANPLAEIRAAHMLCTHSALRSGGIITHKAGCSCGARYDWYRREAEHVEHVDAVIVARIADAWDEGYGDDTECNEPRSNPYRATEEQS